MLRLRELQVLQPRLLAQKVVIKLGINVGEDRKKVSTTSIKVVDKVIEVARAQMHLVPQPPQLNVRVKKEEIGVFVHILNGVKVAMKEGDSMPRLPQLMRVPVMLGQEAKKDKAIKVLHLLLFLLLGHLPQLMLILTRFTPIKSQTKEV